MALARLESRLQAVIQEKKLAGVVVGAASRDGSFDYLKACGPASLDNNAEPISTNAVFSLASCTKLIASVATVQCIERGLISLGSTIADVLPEWQQAQLLTGITSDGRPLLQPVANPITVAHLLTHTSGIASIDATEIQDYYAASGDAEKATLVRDFFMGDHSTAQRLLPRLYQLVDALPVEPLIFEPGTSWVYGFGLDWAAQMVEKLTGLSLENYCQQNIFHPLDMSTATFRFGDHPEIEKNLVPIYRRNSDSSLSPFPRMFVPEPKVERGGAGACCSTNDYMKLLKSLLREDGKVLRAESTSLLLGYRLPNRTIMKEEEEKAIAFPSHVRLDHSLAGMVNLDKVSEFGRNPGSSFWAGSTSTYWWIDPMAGVCGFYGSAILMLKDQGISERMFKEFEQAVYEHLAGE